MKAEAFAVSQQQGCFSEVGRWAGGLHTQTPLLVPNSQGYTEAGFWVKNNQVKNPIYVNTGKIQALPEKEESCHHGSPEGIKGLTDFEILMACPAFPTTPAIP